MGDLIRVGFVLSDILNTNEDAMQTVSRRKQWVVYRIPVKNDPVGGAAVCSEREWDALTAARPGVFALVRDGIASEGEAERFARVAAGDQRTAYAKCPRQPEASHIS